MAEFRRRFLPQWLKIANAPERKAAQGKKPPDLLNNFPQ
jgi:hypothetical protein